MGSPREADELKTPPITADDETVNPSAWEMIEPGRYQPRRIRGSCRGRALG